MPLEAVKDFEAQVARYARQFEELMTSGVIDPAMRLAVARQIVLRPEKKAGVSA